MLKLNDGRILSVYRRTDKSGLWANISRLEEDTWVNEEEYPLWGAGVNGLICMGDNMSENFNALKFGAPNLFRMYDGTIFCSFWCVEDCVSNVRWVKLRIA